MSGWKEDRPVEWRDVAIDAQMRQCDEIALFRMPMICAQLPAILTQKVVAVANRLSRPAMTLFLSLLDDVGVSNSDA